MLAPTCPVWPTTSSPVSQTKTFACLGTPSGMGVHAAFEAFLAARGDAPRERLAQAQPLARRVAAEACRGSGTGSPKVKK